MIFLPPGVHLAEALPRCRGVMACVILLTVGSAAGAGELPPEILALRQRAQAIAESGVEEARTSGSRELQALESSRAAAGDTDGAARARQQRTEWACQGKAVDGRRIITLNPQKTSRAAAGVKSLPLAEGPGAIEVITGRAALEWESPAEPGWYDVRITHRVAGFKDYSAEESPGPFTKREDSSDPPSAGGYLRISAICSLGAKTFTTGRSLVSTGGNWRTVSMGSIQLEGKSVVIRMEALEAGTRTLADVRLIELIPVAGPTGDAALTAFRALKQKYEENAALSARPVNEIYRKELQRIESEARKTGDTLLIAKTVAERDALDGKPHPDGSYSRPFALGFEPSLDFEARDARPSQAKDYLLGFKTGALVRWKVKNLGIPPGKYNVQLKCRVQLNGGGIATLTCDGGGAPSRVKVDPIIVAGEKRSRDSSVEPGPDTRTISDFTLTIPPEATTLTLEVIQLSHTGGSLFDFRKILLIRTDE